MMFGKTHEDASLKLRNKYSQRQWFAWFPVREVDGRWIWLEIITKKWSAACGGGWRYYANPRKYKRNKTMSKNYNDFCLYCTGNKRKDIRECADRSCPFYPFKRGGLEPEVEAGICKKIVDEALTVPTTN